MAIEAHPSEDLLIDYADAAEAIPNRAELERHLTQCAECALKVSEFGVIAAAMAEEETWRAVDDVPPAPRQRVLQDFATRLATEDEHARISLEPVLDTQYRFAYTNVVRKRRFQTGGVVRLLSERARSECDRDPRFAFALAETACEISDNLPDDYYPAAAVNELRGSAWKDLALVCRYRGGQFLQQALEALDRSERAYRRLVESTVQRATVDLTRAIILWEQARYEEALAFCHRALQIFQARRETERYLQARDVEAQILHRQGQVQLARDAYLEIYRNADVLGDPEMKARACRNLAVAYGDLGDTSAASNYLLIALQIFKALDQPAMVVHTQWSICWVDLVAGRASEAALRLPNVVAELTSLGMAGDAARAELDLAEALFVLGRFDEVVAVCGALVSFFRKANMLSGASTAAAFLKEAAAKRAALEKSSLASAKRMPSDALVREHFAHVREYLGRLRTSPDLPFDPPF
jgi:tetratricopeptide (TPR) repeat protein